MLGNKKPQKRCGKRICSQQHREREQKGRQIHKEDAEEAPNNLMGGKHMQHFHIFSLLILSFSLYRDLLLYYNFPWHILLLCAHCLIFFLLLLPLITAYVMHIYVAEIANNKSVSMLSYSHLIFMSCTYRIKSSSSLATTNKNNFHVWL